MDSAFFQQRNGNMNKTGAYGISPFQPRDDDASSIDSMRRELRERPPPNPIEIVTDAPEERFKLGYFDVICLILNRMIGSGIFMTPQTVMKGTHSTGASLLFWFAGVLYALAGMHVYIEYGLNVPRIVYRGVEQSVPRSGGDLNYLQYVFRWLGYRGQTVLPITCLFGISFIVLGNMAGNCINFSVWIARAANTEASEGTVRGIAIATATFACFVHAFSRRGGIWLNNLLAIIKLLMLLLIIITAIVVAAGTLPKTENVISDNANARTAFANASHDANGYASGFLAIIFAFSGFEQPNYVLGEISKPRRRFPISMIVGTSTVCLLYMATNIAYMVVVPKDEQIASNVAQRFFELTYGQLSPHDNTGYRIFSAFLAISSFGNIVVMTFTAARVKQEIAKQGILPWARFFAQNKDVSVGRLLYWLKKKGWFLSILKYRWFSPKEHSEKTPVGALILHFFSCLVLIFATYRMKAADAYSLLTGLAAYIVNAFFGVFLSLGILLLRFHGVPPTSRETAGLTWIEMTRPGIEPRVSMIAAVIFLIGNTYPVVAKWVPPTSAFTTTLKWYLVPLVGWIVVGAGALWFLGFLVYAKRRERKYFEVFTVEKAPEFESANGNNSQHDDESGRGGGLVLVHETIYLAWEAKEIIEKEGRDISRT